jgi:CheY-like chemotaxis protein
LLVVDDNHDSAISLAMLLKALGHEVDTAFDGLAAIDRVSVFKPSVVLLDIGMPGLNGYDTARRIRTLQNHNGVKLVALTGWGQEDDRRRSEEAGFDAHLVKPVDLPALNKLLTAWSDG